MKRSKRERKISKVMGEFKDGTLKSGGSGRKVTNPKQAIAIALSEAEGMNQGGMMYNQIMQRPMFQTPQQRQGMGIMAGVAPVRGYAEGDLVSDDFFSLEQTEEGSGMNLRDITDFFFDPSDPVDYATLGLIAFPPALVAARLAKMGVKGAKAAEQVQKVVKLQEALPRKIGGGTSRARSGLQVQMAALPAALAEEDIAMADEMPQDIGGIAALTAEQPEIQERRAMTRGERKMRKMREAEKMAMGGIASLPGYSRGEAVIKGATALFNRLFRKASKGEDVRKDALDAEQAGKLTPNQTDAILNQAESQMDLPGIPPAATKVDDVIEGRQKNIFARNPGKTVTGLGIGLPAAALVGSGLMGPDAPTPPETPIMLDQSLLPPSSPSAATSTTTSQPQTQSNVEEEVEKKEPATGITKFLLGTDAAFGGDEEGEKGAIDFLRGKPASFLQKTMNYLADPRTQYGLARAAESRAGVVDRNFLTDFTLGQAEYDEAKAKRDYMESQARNLDRTDTEKLVDYYLESIAAKNPNLSVDDLASIRTGLNMSLFKSQQNAADLASKLEILALIPNSAITEDIFNKLSAGALDQNLLDMIAGEVIANQGP